MKKNKILYLVIFVIVVQVAGLIGSIFTGQSVDSWYQTLIKPEFNPPSWVFGPVWTILYLMMAVAAFFVWQKGLNKKAVKCALLVFVIQLALNVLWSFLFFGLQNPFFAFIELIILWIAILLTIIKFYKVSKPAAWLLIPYILWVSFAAILNFAIWQLNM